MNSNLFAVFLFLVSFSFLNTHTKRQKAAVCFFFCLNFLSNNKNNNYNNNNNDTVTCRAHPATVSSSFDKKRKQKNHKVKLLCTVLHNNCALLLHNDYTCESVSESHNAVKTKCTKKNFPKNE